MKTRLLLLATLITFAYSNSFSQTVIYSEDFDGALTWTLNTDIGVEGALPNNWYISCFEDGLPIGA